MDRIERLMKDAKPQVGAQGAAPGPDSLRSIVSSTDPDVIHLARHAPARRTPARRTAVRAAAVTVLAAAAVVGAVVVGGNLMPQPAPGPAQTGVPTPETSASTPPASPAASPTAAPTASTATTQPPASTPAPAGTAALTTGGVACTPANIDQLRNDQQRTVLPIPQPEQAYYTVLGCADGWLAYSISDEGVKALQLDGGNAWFRIAKLQNGRFLWDIRQEWAVVFNWEFQALNNQGLTAQQAMDKEFEQKGVPVELRPQLVGDGPAAG